MSTKFGYPARDRVTNFEGTVTGVAEYISGCTQVLLAGKSRDGAEPTSLWFDIQRIERLGGDPIVLDNSLTPGPDRPAPVR